MRTHRIFLEHTEQSDSYIVVCVDKDNQHVSLKLTDCDRRIWWQFGRPGDKRAIRKIAKVKKIVDQLHAFLSKGGA